MQIVKIKSFFPNVVNIATKNVACKLYIIYVHFVFHDNCLTDCNSPNFTVNIIIKSFDLLDSYILSIFVLIL